MSYQTHRENKQIPGLLISRLPNRVDSCLYRKISQMQSKVLIYDFLTELCLTKHTGLAKYIS